MPRRESRLWPAPASPARPRAWRDGAARSFRGLPRADGGDQGRIFSGRLVAEEVERAAMIFASFGAASGDMPPRIFVAGESLVGIDALKLKGVGGRKSVVSGTSVSSRVELGGRRLIKKKNTYTPTIVDNNHKR